MSSSNSLANTSVFSLSAVGEDFCWVAGSFFTSTTGETYYNRHKALFSLAINIRFFPLEKVTAITIV